jgi:hypothetical protein
LMVDGSQPINAPRPISAIDSYFYNGWSESPLDAAKRR